MITILSWDLTRSMSNERRTDTLIAYAIAYNREKQQRVNVIYPAKENIPPNLSKIEIEDFELKSGAMKTENEKKNQTNFKASQ